MAIMLYILLALAAYVSLVRVQRFWAVISGVRNDNLTIVTRAVVDNLYKANQMGVIGEVVLAWLWFPCVGVIAGIFTAVYHNVAIGAAAAVWCCVPIIAYEIMYRSVRRYCRTHP